jgi:hypothetical protein
MARTRVSGGSKGDGMLSSGIIDLAIGLVFVFGVTAALSSVFTELIARFLGLRGAYLLGGLRELLDGTGSKTALNDAVGNYNEMKTLVKGAVPATPPAATATKSATGALLGSPILRSQGMIGQISSRNLTVGPGKPGRPSRITTGTWKRPWRACRSLPSYISAQSFSAAIIDLLVPNAAGQTTMAQVQDGINTLPGWMPALKESLQTLAANAGEDIDLFRTSVENWYDDHMSRVSGWYKRHVAKITIVVGAILILLLNINTLTIGRTLWNNSVVRTAVSSVAAKTTSCQNQSQQDCLASLQKQLSEAAQAGLPIGWATVPDCAAPKTSCNWLDQRGIFSRHGGSGWEVVLVLIGFLITIIALTPGARFWFDILGKLGSLRTTGPKPAVTPPSGA